MHCWPTSKNVRVELSKAATCLIGYNLIFLLSCSLLYVEMRRRRPEWSNKADAINAVIADLNRMNRGVWGDVAPIVVALVWSVEDSSFCTHFTILLTLHHSAIPLHNSAFPLHVHHSAFSLHHSAFPLHHSAFPMHHSAFTLRHSVFPRTSFCIPSTSICVHSTSFCVHSTSFCIHSTSFCIPSYIILYSFHTHLHSQKSEIWIICFD